jgi:hypothetical protein
MRYIVLILLVVISTGELFSQESNVEVPYTLSDRDRLVRNEQKIDALRQEMNIRFDSVNRRIDDLQNQMGFMTTLLMFVLGAIMSLIGFVIYDRRTAIKPVQRDQKALIDLLGDYAKEDKRLKELMKNAGLL